MVTTLSQPYKFVARLPQPRNFHMGIDIIAELNNQSSVVNSCGQAVNEMKF